MPVYTRDTAICWSITYNACSGNLPGQVAAARGRGINRCIVTSKSSTRDTCLGFTGTLMGTSDACQGKGYSLGNRHVLDEGWGDGK